jgi:hypothetical protein
LGAQGDAPSPPFVTHHLEFPMPFQFDDRMIHDYWHQGYVVFRGIVPPSLLHDLRREIDKARDYVHRERGPQVQRLQPVVNYPELLNLQPFRDYNELPELAAAVTRLLGPGYRHSRLAILGILVEPCGHSYHHGWHRDGVVEVPPDAYDARLREVVELLRRDPFSFNQVNCPVYFDSSTWFVPGSHARLHDLPGEVQTSGTAQLPHKSEGESETAFELRCLEHCRSFPGAVQVHLGPGDYMLYRNIAWHCGNYLKYQPRGTLHDTCAYEGPRPPLPFDWGQEKKDAIARLQARRQR